MSAIYVAGRTTNIEQVQRVQRMCQELGHKITFDWTEQVKQVDHHIDPDAPMPEGFGRECAENDRTGTQTAQYLIAIMGHDLCGTLIEIGMALAFNTTVFLLGDPERESVFFELPEVVRVPDEAGLRTILEGLAEEAELFT